MNLAQQIAIQGFTVQEQVSAVQLLLLSSGETFIGIIEPLSDIETQMELGPDAREASRLHVRRTNCPKQLLRPDAQSQVKLTLAGQAAPIWKLVTRTDNPADIELRFMLVKITGQDAP